jgi:hypothetical protein
LSDSAPVAQPIDRRYSDPAVAELALEIAALKGEVEQQGRKVDDLHEAIFGDGNGNAGLKQTLDDVHTVVVGARSVIRAAQVLANGTGKSADVVTGGVKRYWVVIAAVGALVTYQKTGHLPDWVWSIFGGK